ncbi:4'-phosphopantetheinyl transferase superfamily protein [Amnibacterium sp. CER49]|uniref:4'-phosphopantetheinyl transferase family protein n=1 Tax=Amnibacterium sp. CER49 TaxID=3039161 RepID=UPI00244973B8|nr:4'-phosphopantetheinyl transferase superfamily protein [Amnibacterium sp. CER49]MDH2442830.1 4'-phosphopantetheinyl transferase superfamily protein [Amnibacterium sp. CER49]
MAARASGIAVAAPSGARPWQVAVDVPGVPPGVAVRVLRLELAEPRVDLDAAATVLSPAERERAARGAPSVRRRRILVRAALRDLLAEVLGTTPAAVPLAPEPGRPRLLGTACGVVIDASCSSSGDVGLVAVAQAARIGVDVERLAHDDLRIAAEEGWLAPGERDAITALPVAERGRALTRAWVQKEAVLKGEGSGLRADPSWTVTPIAERGRVRRWWLLPLEVPPAFVASLAVAPAE